MDDLYREEILSTTSARTTGGRLEEPGPRVRGHQPALRRRAARQLKVADDGTIEDLRFDGHGCAISQAAASMASDEVKGMKVDELLQARPRVHPRPARHRHLRDAHEVRAALAEGAQGRRARPRGRVGARDAALRGRAQSGGAMNSDRSNRNSISPEPSTSAPSTSSRPAPAHRRMGGPRDQGLQLRRRAARHRGPLLARQRPARRGRVRREACTVECPRHGSLFDLRTGTPKTLPAYVPVETFAVLVEDDMIKLEVE